MSDFQVSSSKPRNHGLNAVAVVGVACVLGSLALAAFVVYYLFAPAPPPTSPVGAGNGPTLTGVPQPPDPGAGPAPVEPQAPPFGPGKGAADVRTSAVTDLNKTPDVHFDVVLSRYFYYQEVENMEPCVAAGLSGAESGKPEFTALIREMYPEARRMRTDPPKAVKSETKTPPASIEAAAALAEQRMHDAAARLYRVYLPTKGPIEAAKLAGAQMGGAVYYERLVETYPEARDRRAAQPKVTKKATGAGTGDNW